jgi:hypothetical protein
MEYMAKDWTFLGEGVVRRMDFLATHNLTYYGRHTITKDFEHIILPVYQAPEPASETGKDKKNPFLQLCTLLNLESGINSYAGYANTEHGAIFGVVLYEVVGTAANLQASMFKPSVVFLLSPLTNEQ